MASALRPSLRPNHLPSLPLPFPTSTATPTIVTYICQSCRHARLLKRPKRPYTFTQLVTLSDGSAFTIRTTSPIPVYRSTRDTRNSALWNPTSKELLSVEDDESGRLAGFRARFGTGFDSKKETVAVKSPSPSVDTVSTAAPAPPQAGIAIPGETRAPTKEPIFEDEQNNFEEDDVNLLDLISSFGRENTEQSPSPKEAPSQGPTPKKAGKK
ncbi:uncharacterized protein Z518_09218 [Rhinocladiella mackenziei CBS 650.93]|uniref:Ribosomal protein bL31m N-terminal domain-containing protein n=1 Tax=Rhinocladiella mackenziei CBS 650.93 TaxID=1442369 RepID=A0A0D2FHQ2_9EURO|nr:uncharacterized protein Z518_09218 [Rhinocladiella mackenziei CBS 650.93]KIX01492.1 hypothetical protein Z518_09218 [Rhinocladiella mackenziei CBS 650.93]